MRKVILRIAGVLFTLYGLYIIADGVGQWVQQLEQRDWEIRMATVTEVTQREERQGGFRRHSNTVTVYDYTYEYYVDGEYFYGRAEGSVLPRDEGDLVDVKFDPDNPEESTHILSVQWDALALNIGGAVVFCVAGLWLLDLRPAAKRFFLRKDRKT